MPDKHGFNHLGDDVRCIDCPTGGPLGRWSEHKRAQHALTHGRIASDLRRPRPLLAVSPATSHEEKEATMPTTTATTKRASAKEVAIDVLRTAGQPLRASEIAKQVLASGRCAGLKGKTPEATISAMLAVGSKPGGPFNRVDKGTYTLSDSAGTSKAAETKPAATSKRPATRKPTAAAKSKSAAKRPTTNRTTAKRAR
jgi:HB1, ASXL, restriction endonuclease HTH domain